MDAQLYAAATLPATASRTTRIPLTAGEFIYRCMGLTTLGLALFMGVMLRVASLSLSWSWVSMMATGAVPLALVFTYCHWRGFGKLREGVLIVLWAGVMSQLLMFPMYAAARTPFPLRDVMFARMDSALGIETPRLLAWLSLHQTLQTVLAHSYDVLFPMMIAAAILPAMTGRLVAAREFVIANLASVLMAIPIFALLPAVGPWIPYHMAPSLQQSQCAQTLLLLRQPGLFRIDPYYTSGLICFPSFHVILAVLSTLALWSIRPLRLVALILCFLVTFSTISTGWHYSIDVFAGLACAAFSIAAAKAFTKFYQRLDANQ